MANTGFKGLDVRQTGSELVFRAFLQTSAGALLTSGTVNFYLIELQSDGSIKTYDFNDNTFKTTACTTETLAAAYKKSNNNTTDTGLWTAALSTLTGFTVGGIYILRVNCSGASPTDQMREFQYGSAEGDLSVTASGSTGVSYITSDTQFLKGSASTGSAGYVGIDWGHVNAPTTTVVLSGTTINTVTNQLTAAQIATGVWQDTTSGDFTVANSIGKSLYTSGNVPGAAGGIFIAGSNASTTVNFTGNLSGSSPSAIATAVWEDLLAGGDFGTAGSIGALLSTNINATITSRMATYTQPTGFLSATFPSGTIANTTNITAGTITNTSQVAGVVPLFTGQYMQVDMERQQGNTFTAVSPPTNWNLQVINGSGASLATVNSYVTNQDPATLVLNAVAASYNTSGTIGAKINASGSSGDPWTTIIPGSYGAGTAGYIVGNMTTGLITPGKVASSPAPTTSTFKGLTPSGGPLAATVNYYVNITVPLQICWTSGLNEGLKVNINGYDGAGNFITDTVPFAPLANDTFEII